MNIVFILFSPLYMFLYYESSLQFLLFSSSSHDSSISSQIHGLFFFINYSCSMYMPISLSFGVAQICLGMTSYVDYPIIWGLVLEKMDSPSFSVINSLQLLQGVKPCKKSILLGQFALLFLRTSRVTISKFSESSFPVVYKRHTLSHREHRVLVW